MGCLSEAEQSFVTSTRWSEMLDFLLASTGASTCSVRPRTLLAGGARRGGLVLRYCRNVHPTWVRFNSKDTKESERWFAL